MFSTGRISASRSGSWSTGFRPRSQHLDNAQIPAVRSTPSLLMLPLTAP
jgi:hypothetical protein